MEKRKKLLTILSTAIIVTAIFAPLLFVKTVVAADPTDWYMTVNGVLATDTYSLYPFEEESLKFGLSKFGELIDSSTNVGLEYAGARDPFAAPAGSSVDESKLPKKVWINGWYIDIKYVHEDWGQRHVWAGALFADKTDYGKNWIRVDNNYTYPLSPQYEWQETFDDKGLELDEDLTPIPGLVNGGRKTNGTAVTEDLTVLYDGPRLFVAKSVTHIYDWNEDEDENLHIVDVVLTIMYNKVKKEVVVLKDVKMIDQAKFVIADLPITTPDDEEITIPMAMLIQFSNREEWDLGAKNVAGTIDYSSYVHFYTAGTGTNDADSEGQDTVYNMDWTMLPTLPAGVTYEGVEINAWGPEPGASGTYDVAQIISNDKKYVGWHAFWPSLSDWSADAARSSTKTWYRAMKASDPHWIDSYSGSEPFLSPLIVGEWDFILADREEEYDGINVGRQFRGVSVYGVTDLHDGDDATKVIDREAQYQLNEVFNPWDLYDTVEKQTERYVYLDTLEEATSSIQLVDGIDTGLWEFYPEGDAITEYSHEEAYSKYWSVKMVNTADDEPAFEIDVSASGLTLGSVTEIFSYWQLVTELGELPGAWIRINGPWDSDERIDINWEPSATEDVWEHHVLTPDTLVWDDKTGTTNTLEDYLLGEVDDAINATSQVYAIGFAIGAGEDTTAYIDDVTIMGYTFNFEDGKLIPSVWDVYCGFAERVLVNGTLIPRAATVTGDMFASWISTTRRYQINFTDGTISFQKKVSGSWVTWTLSADTEIKVLYSIGAHDNDTPHGRYEWAIVGRDAASVDSAGAALVTAAFKNKQVEIGLAGADMYDPEVANQMPWVMHKFGTDDDLADYYYSDTDYRTALKDDWCTTWPISSSNMIGVGGPLANILAYYGNDFAQAIFGLNTTDKGDFTDYADWEEVIIPLTCWDITKTQAYSSNNTVGYAVISTYKDINGTVLFLVWGHWGRDTYYACKWFHEEGIYQLQDAPDGLTAIILEISYKSSSEGYKPKSFSIVECLGTISETEWTHGSETKGGIHDP